MLRRRAASSLGDRGSPSSTAADHGAGATTVEVHGDGPRADAHRAAVASARDRTGWTLHDETSDPGRRSVGVNVFAEPLTTSNDQIPAILRSLGSGRAVAIEAPWQLSVDRLRTLVDAQFTSQTAVLYAEPLCHAPAVTRTLASLDTLGGVDRIESRHAGPDRGLGVGGLLATPIALVVLVARRSGAGTVVSATARPDTPSPRGPSRPAAGLAAVIEFEHGLRALVTAQVAEVRSADLQVSGPSGVLRTEFFPEPVLEHDGEPVELPRPGSSPPGLEQFGHGGQLEALAEAIRFGSAPSTDAAFGVQVSELISRVDGPSR